MKWKMGFLAGLLSAFVSVTAFAASAVGTWDANTEPDLAGYKIYYGTSSGVYGTPIDVGNVTTYKVEALADSTNYCFALTAYDNSGNESDKGSEVCVTTGDFTPPDAPQNAVWTTGP